MTLRTNGFVLRIAVLVDAYELLDDLSSAQVAFGLQELPQLVLLGRRLEVDVQPFRRFEFFQRHCLCDLYGYIVLSFDSGDELLQGRARVEDFALDPIPAHDKAAGRVVGVLPLWIRMPRKCGTSCRYGSRRLKRGLYSMVSR